MKAYERDYPYNYGALNAIAKMAADSLNIYLKNYGLIHAERAREIINVLRRGIAETEARLASYVESSKENSNG